jgi:tetratricopeptide (TPR) repeat protein
VSEHPDPAVLGAFGRGALPAAEMQAVALHLLRGCAPCHEALSPAAAAFLAARLPPPVTNLDVYEIPIRLGERAAFRQTGERDRERAYAEREVAALLAGRPFPAGLPAGDPRGLRGRDRCEALRSASWALRHEDPQEMVERACAAAAAAEMLDPAAFPPGEAADLRALAWAELGNAYRVANQLGRAEAALEQAMVHQRDGTGDRLVLARLMDLAASLYTARRRFGAARGLLAEAAAIFEEHGEHHLAGRALISQGISSGFANRLWEGIGLLRTGLARIDQASDPYLTLSAVHGLIDFTLKLDRFEEARDLIRESQGLYAHLSDDLYLLKRRWQEAKIEAGLGRLSRGEAMLLEVKKEYEKRQMPYLEALVSIDLASVWLLQKKTAELPALIDAMAATFGALGIEREQIAALLLLQKATRDRCATLALVQTATAELERLERGAAGRRRS